jgi:hypothetical protein
MSTLEDQIITQIGALIAQYEPLVHTYSIGRELMTGSAVEVQAAQSRLTAAIHRYTLPGDPYRDELKRIQDQKRGFIGSDVPLLLGVLHGLKSDYESGHLQTVEQLVHADLFTDFLAMATELLDKGFKGPAAVLGGSVLEEHLRKLADKTITTDGAPRKAEAINTELGTHIYGRDEQKQVTAWLAIRNIAAHGHWSTFQPAQVALMLQGVDAFVIRHPA